jgi:hypothetical protein
MGFKQLKSGDTILVGKKWVIACCDCALTHTLRIRQIPESKEHFLVRVDMNPSLTKKRRRDRAGKLKMVPK